MPFPSKRPGESGLLSRKRVSHLRRVDVSLLTLHGSGFENGKGF
jgi:hypothetical protein